MEYSGTKYIFVLFWFVFERRIIAKSAYIFSVFQGVQIETWIHLVKVLETYVYVYIHICMKK